MPLFKPIFTAALCNDTIIMYSILLALTTEHANQGLVGGVAVSGVRHMNEAISTSGPVSTWMGDRLPAGTLSRYVTSQLGQLSLASLRGG